MTRVLNRPGDSVSPGRGLVLPAREPVGFMRPRQAVRVTDSLVFPAPTNPDFLDSAVSIGTVFHTSVDAMWIGNRIRISATLPGVALVAFAGGIQSKSFVGVAGATMDVLFDAVTPVTAGVDYTAGYFTDRYAYTNNQYPFTSLDGMITATGGLFDYGATPVNPTNPTGLFFQVGPLIQF